MKASKGTALLRSQHGNGTDSEIWVCKPPRFCCVCCLKTGACQIQNCCSRLDKIWHDHLNYLICRVALHCVSLQCITSHSTVLASVPCHIHSFNTSIHPHTQMHTYHIRPSSECGEYILYIYIRLHPYTWRPKESGDLKKDVGIERTRTSRKRNKDRLWSVEWPWPKYLYPICPTSTKKSLALAEASMCNNSCRGCIAGCPLVHKFESISLPMGLHFDIEFGQCVSFT